METQGGPEYRQEDDMFEEYWRSIDEPEIKPEDVTVYPAPWQIPEVTDES